LVFRSATMSMSGAKIIAVGNGAKVYAAVNKKVSTRKVSGTRSVSGAPSRGRATGRERVIQRIGSEGAGKNAFSATYLKEGRPLWYPGASAPDYLDGSLPGDFGFDPFGLGKPVEYLQIDLDQLDQSDRSAGAGEVNKRPTGKNSKGEVVKGIRYTPTTSSAGSGSSIVPYETAFGLERYRECEIIHGRWCMLAVLGCLTVEGLGFGNWGDAGALELTDPQYFGISFGDAYSLKTVSIVEALAMGYVEFARNSETDPEQRIYPGGAFDPLGLAKDPDTAFRLRTAEVKHGRLAMVAMLGFAWQFAANGLGPLEALGNAVPQ